VRYARQNLADADRLEHMRRLEEYMVREKPYLDQRISLSDISESLSIPVHHLSMVINIEKKQNFFGFINSYRIAAAKAILSSAEFAERTLLDAGFMSGFQSKAAFNRVFKEHTGMTPGQYRAFAQKKITSP
ncbi:MAG TPA: AraC family transcriptional regulator, partial [Leptospiraceae bacterium]|nr:AraC family transcriptional regulator [Leptospiraceae bacterium]